MCEFGEGEYVSNRYMSRGGMGDEEERFRKRRRGRSVVDRPGLVGGGRGIPAGVVSAASSPVSSVLDSRTGGGGGSIYPLLLSHIRLISPATFTVHTGCVNACERTRSSRVPEWNLSR